MGRKVIRQLPRADPRAYVGKRRDRSNVWKPCRNPLLEQMHPMPPATVVNGASRMAREATFDPLRGVFIALARPNDPEPKPPEPRRGLGAMDPCRDPGQIKAVMSDAEHRSPLKLPRIHKRRPPPGTHTSSDLGTVMQMQELTEGEKVILWRSYQTAMERSIKREGELDGLTWRHRVTHEPAPPLPHRRCLTKPTARAPPPYGAADVPESSLLATVLRSGRRLCRPVTKDQGERLLSWKEMQGDRVDPRTPRKLPPTYDADDGHMDAILDDERSVRLAVPMHKQRRHILGHAGEIGGTIRPISDRERRELHAQELHEFSIPKKPKPIPPPPALSGRLPYRRPSQPQTSRSCS